MSHLESNESPVLFGSILADLPRLFYNSEDVMPTLDPYKPTPFSITNRGLVIEMMLATLSTGENDNHELDTHASHVYGLLNCRMKSHRDSFIAIRLVKRGADNSYKREWRNDLTNDGQTQIIVATELLRFDHIGKSALRKISIRGSDQLVSYDNQQQTHVTMNYQTVEPRGFKLIEIRDLHTEQIIKYQRAKDCIFSVGQPSSARNLGKRRVEKPSPRHNCSTWARKTHIYEANILGKVQVGRIHFEE
jgi:hypothetical protein